MKNKANWTNQPTKNLLIPFLTQIALVQQQQIQLVQADSELYVLFPL